MSSELGRLIARYRWLQSEAGSSEAAQVINSDGACSFDEVREEIFLQIMRYPADDPRISLRQIEFLLEMLAEQGLDLSVRLMVRDEVLTHVRRLVSRAPSAARADGARRDHLE